jgi:hypothetical protein
VAKCSFSDHGLAGNSVQIQAKSMLTRSQPFGYTASVWRRSSMAVFRPVGDGKTLLVSPPQFSGSFEAKKWLNRKLVIITSTDWRTPLSGMAERRF